MAPKKPPEPPAKGGAGDKKPPEKGAGDKKPAGKGPLDDVKKFFKSPTGQKVAYGMIISSFIGAVLMSYLCHRLNAKNIAFRKAVKQIRSFANGYDPRIRDKKDIDAINLAQNLTEELIAIAVLNDRVQREYDLISKTIHDWTPYQRKLYHFSNEFKSWPNAKEDCIKRGSQLASVMTGEEQRFIDKVAAKRQKGIWLGLIKNNKKPNKLEWLNGVRAGTLYWDEHQPNFPDDDKKEACISTYFSQCDRHCWHDDECSLLKLYVCKLEPNREWYD